MKPAAAIAIYVGEERCAQCHAEQVQAWRTSHHAKAMQVASDSSVLGDFNNARFAKHGVTSSFSKKGGKFYVRTDGPDGKLQDYELPYTFGVSPLQQYLVAFPNGRLQSFVVAWDSRSKQQDGQHWFHLYPDQTLTAADPLHWTGRNQTWNYMCADCHSTNLRKNYDLATDSYATTWSDIDVSCESCHGPGSNHVAWAQARKEGSYKPSNSTDGLVVDLKPASGSWSVSQPDMGTMHWKGQARSHNEINTCAPCHSRRHPITSEFQPGQPFLDTYVPSLLEEGVYYPDGQILEEDYEWGSFLQSKMYNQGVTCSDCHDPHTAKLPQVGLNAVCGKCHSLAKFGSEQHHHHKADSAGALCVNCHMPTRTYMVIDARRDHSFRVPRPDFSVAYGTPNACNLCHRDKSNGWAVDTVVKWYGANRRHEAHFVEAIDAGRRGLPDAEKELTALIQDPTKPGIARATALSLLPAYLTPASMPAVQTALRDNDALVRSQAVRSLEPLPPQQRVGLAAPLLSDPVRSVRIETGRLLAGTPPDLLQDTQKTALDRDISELIASEMASAERPENHMNLALLYAQMGRTSDAESELKTALRLDPKFVPAMVNFADLYRQQQRDDEGQQWLEKAIKVAPDAAEPVYALGLLKVRQKQYQEALSLLAKAAMLQPNNVQYSYGYAVALQSSGRVSQAITVLQQAHQRRPADREVLDGLISFERDNGNIPTAIVYAQQLVELVPDDPGAKATLQELQRQVR
ncbi:MAG: tetratricopeptide repeat protein [Candidatus Korobacteraceae bacterium]|jgi:tetratricopeptide (TPR) repeat protein